METTDKQGERDESKEKEEEKKKKDRNEPNHKTRLGKPTI